MNLNEHITVNYDILYQAAKNITKGHQLTDDLFSHCIEVLLVDPNKEKIQNMVDKNQIRFYFVSLLIRNYHSSTSRFHYQYRKPSDMLADNDVYDMDTPDDTYNFGKEAKMTFIEGELEKLDWYDKQMVRLYFYENMSYRKISDLTNIPKTSVYNSIKQIKNKIKGKI